MSRQILVFIALALSAAVSAQDGCGETEIFVEPGQVAVVESPNYPDDYPDNLNCQWSVSTSEDARFSITAERFDIEYCGVDCVCDAVQVHDGASTSDPLLNQRQCGEFDQDDLQSEFSRGLSSTPDLLVAFQSDSITGEGGFRFNLLAEYASYDCGGQFDLEEDLVIESPNYPSDYYNDTECTWDLTAPQGSRISLEYQDVSMGPCADDIEGCPTETQLCPCNCDWMQAYEGFQEVEGAGPRICDDFIIDNPWVFPTLTEGNEMRIKFISDQKGTARGFRVRAIVV